MAGWRIPKGSHLTEKKFHKKLLGAVSICCLSPVLHSVYIGNIRQVCSACQEKLSANEILPSLDNKASKCCRAHLAYKKRRKAVVIKCAKCGKECGSRFSIAA